MIPTFIGTLLLLAPFSLLLFFKDKIIGFVTMLSLVVILNTAFGIVTQMFSVFTYDVILMLHILTASVCFFIFYKWRSQIQYQCSIDWVLIAVISISFLSIVNIHHNYNGKYSVATTPEYQEAEHLSYPYPYFSDEWYTVALINDSITAHELPIKNPLNPERTRFLNLEMPFHSILAEIIMLLNLNPLTSYVNVALIVSVLTIVLIYFFLKKVAVDSLPAGIAALSVLYITNGANLPGIWYLLPVNLGLLSMLAGFIFIASHYIEWALFMGFFTIFLYPPLFVFYMPALIIATIQNSYMTKKEIKFIIINFILITFYTGLIFITFFILKSHSWSLIEIILIFKNILFIIALAFPTKQLLKKINIRKIIYTLVTADITIFIIVMIYSDYGLLFNKIFNAIHYTSFTADAIPQYAFWHVLLIPILIFGILGLFYEMRTKTWLFAATGVGIVYWIFYMFETFRFIIEYERVIFVTAIFITIAAGIGFSYSMQKLMTYSVFKGNKKLIFVQVGIIALFALYIPWYSERDVWRNLTLQYIDIGATYFPAAPINRYLHPDDLKIFKNIHNKSFLSDPWKGTVLGVATDNYPLTTKPGTITINQTLAKQFEESSCGDKKKLVIDGKIDYVYFKEVNCAGFKRVDESAEGLTLYQVVK